MFFFFFCLCPNFFFIPFPPLSDWVGGGIGKMLNHQGKGVGYGEAGAEKGAMGKGRGVGGGRGKLFSRRR